MATPMMTATVARTRAIRMSTSLIRGTRECVTERSLYTDSVRKRGPMSTAIRFAIAVLLLAAPMAAQNPNCNGNPQLGAIPNFRGVTSPGSFTLSWDPPAGVTGTPVYEILQETASDYCSIPNNFSVVATTTANTY